MSTTFAKFWGFDNLHTPVRSAYMTVFAAIVVTALRVQLPPVPASAAELHDETVTGVVSKLGPEIVIPLEIFPSENFEIVSVVPLALPVKTAADEK